MSSNPLSNISHVYNSGDNIQKQAKLIKKIIKDNAHVGTCVINFIPFQQNASLLQSQGFFLEFRGQQTRITYPHIVAQMRQREQQNDFEFPQEPLPNNSNVQEVQNPQQYSPPPREQQAPGTTPGGVTKLLTPTGYSVMGLTGDYSIDPKAKEAMDKNSRTFV